MLISKSECRDIGNEDANIFLIKIGKVTEHCWIFFFCDNFYKQKKHSCTKSYLFGCLHVIYFFISTSKVSDTRWMCKFVWEAECVIFCILFFYCTITIWDSCAIAVY